MTYAKATMPWKIELREPDGKRHVFYASMTDWLSYNENYFSVEIYASKIQGNR